MRYFLLLLLVSTLTQAQNIHFKNVTTKGGLSNNSVNTIWNNQDGSLWIGTWDGLNLYDGKKFTVFKHQNNNKSSIAGNTINKLLKDKYGQLWIWSDDRSISRYLGNATFENYHFNEGIVNMHLSADGVVLLRFKTGKVLLFDGKTFEPAPKMGFAETTKEKLIKQMQRLFPAVQINDVLQDGERFFWIATKDQGLYAVVQTEGQFQIQNKYRADPFNTLSFLSDEIAVLHRDVLGNIWLGTKDGGLSMMVNRREKIETVYLNQKSQPFLPSETVRAITEDRGGNLWLGYYTQGVFRQDSATKVLLPYPLDRAKENPDWLRIRSLFTDSAGSIWIGTYAGVVQIKEGKPIYYEKGHTSHFSNNRNYHFFERDGILWIACWGGIAKFDMTKQQFMPFVNLEALLPYHIRHISSDGYQLVLATEKEGVLFYDLKSGEINVLTQEQGVLGNSIFSVYIDGYTKDIWIASLGGIAVFSADKTLKHQITEENGLPSHLVYSFLPYKNNMWISTTKGVASIDKKTLELSNFSNYIGWQGLEFSEGAAYQNTKGKLMFAGNKGVNIFEPDQLKGPSHIPYFQLILNGKPIEKHLEIKRSFKENDLKMELYPIGFDSYLKNQFEYRINGLFDDWRTLSDREIVMDKLSPKTYVIEVRDNLKSGKEIVYSRSFEILKPFYAEPLFLIGGVFLIVSVIFWLVRRRQQLLIQREELLKREVALRTSEVLCQKESLTQQYLQLNVLNSEILKQKSELVELHSRFKNSDIEIEKFRIFVLSKIKKPLVKIIENMGGIEVNAKSKKQLVQLYDMLREWDYLEQIKGFGSQNYISIELRSFIDKLSEDWKYIEQKGGIVIQVSTTIQEYWMETDLLRFKFLFKYFINECSKYMAKGEQLDLRFKIKEQGLEVLLYSDSVLLQSYWKENSLYSPYYRAFYTLLQDLKGQLTELESKRFKVAIYLPFQEGNESSNPVKTANLDVFLEEIKILPKDKINLLTYTANHDQLLVQQLLEDKENCHLVYNTRINEVVSNIEHYKFDALILYNIPVNDLLRSLFSQIQKKISKQRLLVFYLAEEVDYFLQEQLAQLGVTDFVHLPLNKNLIEHKIHKRIRYDKQNKESHAYKWSLESLDENDRMESPNERLLRKAMDMMTSHLAAADFGIEQLADKMGISKMKCYRIFKEILQVSPSEVLIQLRLKKAEQLLQQGNLTIAEISFECGFNDPKYFSKTFKKHYDTSPSVFKKSDCGISAGLSEY